jgi:protein involved in polysaccharide export with SLBB domain
MSKIMALTVIDSFYEEAKTCKEYRVGQGDVVKIEEHAAQGDGDKWYYDVYFSNRTKVRAFIPVQVAFCPF